MKHSRHFQELECTWWLPKLEKLCIVLGSILIAIMLGSAIQHKVERFNSEIESLEKSRDQLTASQASVKKLLDIVRLWDNGSYWMSPTADRFVLSFPEQMNFYHAEHYCAKLGGRLPQSLTKDDETAMANALKEETLEGRASFLGFHLHREYTYSNLWLGLRSPPCNGSYRWIESQEEPKEMRWGYQQPHLTEGSDACVYENGGLWFDEDCTAFKQANVTCEFHFRW